jgi:23S rRNA pseudouridine1911/1915/1917 synthase
VDLNNTSTDEIIIAVTADDREKFKRLDVYLAEKISHFSRNFLQNLFHQGQITLDEDSPNQTQKLELKKMPPVGTIINVDIPPPIPCEAGAENIPLEILFEDEHLVIINKPQGLVTHPAPGNYTGTLVNAILYHCPDLKGVGDQRRPGIVHRLDKDTSGVMVVAKDHKTHEGLVELFSKHDIERFYECLCIGKFPLLSGKLEGKIGRHPHNRLKMACPIASGKNAITFFKVLKQYEQAAHIELKLETGRTHQIRVHLSSLLHRSILCDPVYANIPEQLKYLSIPVQKHLAGYNKQMLHAKTLGFVHPITKQKLHFTAKPPEIFLQTMELLCPS